MTDKAAAIARGDYLEGDVELEQSAEEAGSVDDEVARLEAEEAAKQAANEAAAAEAAKAAEEAAAAEAAAKAAEEEAAEEEAVEEEAVEEEAERSKFIPRERFDEVNQRRKRAEEELARRDAEAAAAAEAAKKAEEGAFDFDAKEQEYMDAVIDGDTAKAMALRKEIRTAEQAALRAELETVDTRARDAALAIESQRLADAAIAEVNAKYPMFDPDDAAYDQDLTDEVVAMARAYQGAPHNLTFPEALGRAVGNAAKLYDLVAVGEAPAAAKPPPAKPKPATVQAKIDSVKQPPPPGSSKTSRVEDGGEKSVYDYTDDEFAALPPATRARLRGDVV